MAEFPDIDFIGPAPDLHLSEWADAIRHVAENLHRAAIVWEEFPSQTITQEVSENMEHLESLVGAARRAFSNGPS